MKKRVLGISLGNAFSRKTSEMVRLVSEIGFGAVSPSMPLDGAEFDIAGIARAAKESGVLLSALHAPFLCSAALWQDRGEKGEFGERELLSGIDLCEKYEIPVLVMHAWIGFEPSLGPSALGFERMDRVLKRAKESGVLLAVENTEGEEYLDALLSRYRGRESFGFCYDSGHAHCYNGDRDLLSQYGDRLLFTHINDNLGVSDPAMGITPMDDLHLLPFDGNIDWSPVAARLAAARKTQVLNFELNIRSKQGRHENDAYEKMTYEQYFSEAYRRARRVADMIEEAES